MDQRTEAMMPAGPGAKDRRGIYDGSKPPREIEEDIARTRVRLSASIEALERELEPRRVIEKSAEVLRSALDPGARVDFESRSGRTRSRWP